jgi:thiosulfate/3-mercaptopyruvate sulfurtransferase
MLASMTLPGALVSADWLAARLGHPRLVIADVRWYVDERSGEAAYDAGHLPGAVWVSLDEDLSDGPIEIGPGRHPLPHPKRFAERMAGLGIGDDSVVVAYDDAGGSIAARLWWMLRATGHEVAVLDGGVSAWTGELSLETSPRPRSVVFTERPWPVERVADWVTVDFLRRTEDAVVIDARTADRYNGRIHPLDTRAGHIPGAVSAPWAGNVDPATGRLWSRNELRAHFDGLGVKPQTDVVCYCGSGVTACHNLLALEVAGLGNRARLYPGSWSDWSADPNRPIS